MKKTLLIAAALVLTLAAAAGLYAAQYPIRADQSNLAEYTRQRINQGRSESFPVGKQINLYDFVDIGRDRFVLVEIDESLGQLSLQRGLTGQYRLGSVGYGGGNFRERVVESGGKQYYLLGGRNTDLAITEIVVSLDGREYCLDIPEKKRFFVCTQIDSAIEETHSDLDDMKFFDKDGRDITDTVKWN
ncbi:hypothetical protein KQI82_12010 [Oscillibacter sp. MSJ-2]|uniref:Uncharacterized protein n=1 Tax=Dysosmobacter acutus TaxID=2841504 RepID=A0ABS6FC65_9FIRM|nr:hypothetical protein [Dysosmobacter acutus]MBU5627635.1 hypothetical protein [Dysosmobacter acutus]